MIRCNLIILDVNFDAKISFEKHLLLDIMRASDIMRYKHLIIKGSFKDILGILFCRSWSCQECNKIIFLAALSRTLIVAHGGIPTARLRYCPCCFFGSYLHTVSNSLAEANRLFILVS